MMKNKEIEEKEQVIKEKEHLIEDQERIIRRWHSYYTRMGFLSQRLSLSEEEITKFL